MVKGKFILLSDAYYAQRELKDRDFVDDLSIAPYDENGEECGEIVVQWYDAGMEFLCPALHVFDDNWKFLFGNKELCDLFILLNDQHLQPYDFCALLEHLGYTNATPYVRAA